MPGRLHLTMCRSPSLNAAAGDRLREPNAAHGPGDNYPLVVQLEKPDETAEPERRDRAFRGVIAEHDGPAQGE